MVKIFLDPGHGGKDPGAVANGLQEKDLVLDIAKRIGVKLNQYKDVEIALSRKADVFVELVDRAKLANYWRADYFVSLHINAGGGKGGYEDFRYNGSSDAKTIANQKIINEETIKSIGGINRGTKSANLSVLRNTRMPAILTEVGFIDVEKDAALLKQSAFLDKFAQGHVNGLVKIFNLQLKDEVKVAEVKSTNNEPSTWAKKDWDEAVANSYFDGTRPKDNITREEMAIVVNRLRNNIIPLIK